jgi:hypothetical protein
MTQPTPEQIEEVALKLYAADAMHILAYDTIEQSWAADRKSVQIRYRTLAATRLRAGWLEAGLLPD